ncbi:hypothetical protein [Streptomyces sp. B6B3]|uniref:hypothetical protein n=1 Tax=Streptomyces sp. B6B3 TaxID=3153570 RepID=UPI00325F75EF
MAPLSPPLSAPLSAPPFAASALAAFEPDVCEGGANDWSPIASSGAMSAFSGIVAGFVFAGLVTVIGVKNPPAGDGHASRGLRLLLPCFFGLAVVSYLYAVTAGELVCARAHTEALLAGAALGADAIVVVVALAWLLLAYQRDRHREVRFFRELVHFAAQFSAFMLTGSSVAFADLVLGPRASPWFEAAAWASGGALMVAILLGWRGPPPSPPPPWAPDHWRYEIHYDRRVSVCAWTVLSLSGLLALGSGIASSVPYDAWGRPAPWVVYALAEAALLAAGTILVTAVRAVPRPRGGPGPG